MPAKYQYQLVWLCPQTGLHAIFRRGQADHLEIEEAIFALVDRVQFGSNSDPLRYQVVDNLCRNVSIEITYVPLADAAAKPALLLRYSNNRDGVGIVRIIRAVLKLNTIQ
jgi:hypothetical protein